MDEPGVRIFVSSPSDLEHERAIVKDVIATLAQEYLPYFNLKAILWEEEALTAAQSFQAGLLRPSECEIVVAMLWSRLGTPLAEDPYGGMTGTEWEFVDAVEASARTGSPEVLVYRKIAPRLVDVTDDEATHEALADRRRLEDFFRTHFYNPDGSFARAFRQFSSDRSFRELLETQLRKLLNRRISAERRLVSSLGDWQGSPFRAQRPFEAGDDRIFTGREVETRELVTRLEALHGSGQGLLLLTGASGVGKSSLVRAGLLPRLSRPFLFSGISGCRWCLVDLDECDPVARLAEALRAPSALGQTLDGFGLDHAHLTRLLVSEPAVAADQIVAALAQLGADRARQAGPAGGRTQLAIVVDPLDPIFTAVGDRTDQARSFVAALGVLAHQESLWVIATLRSDYLHRLDEFPELARLLDEPRWFALDPPAQARIRQVIEIPARIAGIEYEAMNGASRGLVEAIESEASLLTHWPPVVQDTLDQLYRLAEQRSQDGVATHSQVLTMADFRQVGGLSGSLLTRADTVWETLDPALRAALPQLCRALISLEGGGVRTLNPRAGDLRTLMRAPEVAGLVERLIDARLLVAGALNDPTVMRTCAHAAPNLADDFWRLLVQTGEQWRVRIDTRRSAGAAGVQAAGAAGAGAQVAEAQVMEGGEPATDSETTDARRWQDHRPIVSFIHPALLERWRPVKAWLSVSDHRRDLVMRYQITRQARLWKRTDCNREYLLGEAGYASARIFADAYPDELEPLEREFLDESLRHLILQRRRNRRARLFGSTLVALLILATTMAFWAWDASREATLNLQRSFLNVADSAIRSGNTAEAIQLALNAADALPVAAADRLGRALTANRLLAMVQSDGQAGDRPLSAAFRADGQQVVVQSPGEGGRLWVLDGRRFLAGALLFDAQMPIHSVRFVGAGDATALVGIGADAVWQLPVESARAPDWTCGARPGSPTALSPNGRYLALSHGDPRKRFAVCMLDLTRPGEPLWDQTLHTRQILSLTFSPDSRLLLSASRDGSARLIDAQQGTERLVLPPNGSLGRSVTQAVFDARGRRIAMASVDERVRVFDLEGRSVAELGVAQRQGESIAVHRSPVRSVAFLPHGEALVAGDDAGQVVMWQLATGQAEILGRHSLAVARIRVSAPGALMLGEETGEEDPLDSGASLVLSASRDGTVRLWGGATATELGVLGHNGAITDAGFSADGTRVWTHSDLDGSARLWSVRPIETISFNLPSADHVAHLTSVLEPSGEGAGPDGSILLAAGSSNHQVEVWRYQPGADFGRPQRLWRFEGHRDRVRRVAFSPSARLLASAGFDGTAMVWDLATGSACSLAVAAHDQPCEPDRGQRCPNVYRVLFAPDERWLLTVSSDVNQPVRLWDPDVCAASGESLNWDHGGRGAQAADLAADTEGGVWVATGDELGTVRLMHLDSDGRWNPVCAGNWHREAVTDLAFAPGAKQLVSVSEDGRAALVKLSPEGCGEALYLEPHAGALMSARFAPDGDALVTAATNASAHIWASDGTLLAELSGHKDRVNHAEISPDGRWVLTASRDGTLRLWPRPFQPRSSPLRSFLSLSAERGGVTFASFMPDGSEIAAAYWNETSRLWRIWTGEGTLDRDLQALWGRDRARLALIREAIRFRRDNHLDRWEVVNGSSARLLD